MDRSTIAVIACTVLCGVVLAGIFWGDLADTSQAWGLAGVFAGALVGILAPQPKT